MTLPQLKAIRWAVRAVLALGVAASIAGNVLHAQDNLISQIISAWSPLALLLTIELISRVPVHSRALAMARWGATAVIAGIAAWVSYWHMAAVAARYGETEASPYLLPLSVDGLVVVASVCLVELAGRIRTATEPAEYEDLDDDEPEPVGGDTDAGADSGEETMEPARPRRSGKRPSAEDRVVAAVRRRPKATPAQIAASLSISERTVQRYWPRPADDTTPPAASADEPERELVEVAR